ncbi:unnamed protein product, partial [Prorocentrum cordatum]
MEIKLLLSVDRGKVSCKEDALSQIDDIVALSQEFKDSPDFVVGMDVCGNPAKPTVVPYVIPAMLERREAFVELPVTFHTGEVVDDAECNLILDSMGVLNIRRLGHVCFLGEAARRRLFEGEGRPGDHHRSIAWTSNLVTRGLTSLADHHFRDWWRRGLGEGAAEHQHRRRRPLLVRSHQRAPRPGGGLRALPRGPGPAGGPAAGAALLLPPAEGRAPGGAGGHGAAGLTCGPCAAGARGSQRGCRPWSAVLSGGEKVAAPMRLLAPE